MTTVLDDLKLVERTLHKRDTAVKTYFDQVGKYKLLTTEEEIECSRKVQAMMKLLEQKEINGTSGVLCFKEKLIIREGRKAKEQMVNANLRLVIYAAKRHPAYSICRDNTSGMELIDLIQEGNIGLARAVEKFEGERGYKFSTYAFWWIKQAMNRSFASTQRAIRIPLHILDLELKIRKADQELRKTLHRKATKKEIAEYLSIAENKVDQVLASCAEVTSLDKLMKEDGSDLHEVIQDKNSLFSISDDLDSLKIESIIEFLPEREKFALAKYYGLNGEKELTYEQIGNELGISRERVRQIIDESIRKIQNKAGLPILKPRAKFKSRAKAIKVDKLEPCYAGS